MVYFLANCKDIRIDFMISSSASNFFNVDKEKRFIETPYSHKDLLIPNAHRKVKLPRSP